MNSYTFVAKNHKQPEGNVKIESSILQRLQQLKKSMRPAQNLQQQYESANSNAHFGLNLSNVQNQRLNKYLPNDNDHKNKQEGVQEFQSYRKSLQKKLNFLFDKQKQILKTQSTYQPSKYNPVHDLISKEQNTFDDKLQRKYDQFQVEQNYNLAKQKEFRLNGRETKSFSNLQPYGENSNHDPNQNRQYRAFSTMEHNNFAKTPLLRQRKDEQIEQMQRKIKILEMKYLRNNKQTFHYDDRLNMVKNIHAQNESENLHRHQNRSKSIKSPNKKSLASPEKVKQKTKNANKKTIQSDTYNQNQIQTINKKTKKNDSNQKRSKQQIRHQKGQQKQAIKDYMNSIHQQSDIENYSRESLLHQQFNFLKEQFQSLLEINKSIIEKVSTNEEEKIRKKQNKQKAKAMLKEILYRLEEIKYQIRQQNVQKSKSKDEKVKLSQLKRQIFDEKTSSWKKSPMRFQKSKSIKNPSQIIKRQRNSKEKNVESKKMPDEDFDKKNENIDDVEKLKKMLDLEVQHRNIVEKKLQLMYGTKNSVE